VKRKKVSAPYNEFVQNLNSLLSLDQKNQARLASGSGRVARDYISRQQLVLLTEGIFLSAYRDFESFLEDVFLLYTQCKPTLSNKKPKSFLNPRDFSHAYELIKSGREFLDWTSPSAVIDRAETYLKDGEPIKLSFTSNQTILNQMKSIRNHIAHNSTKSLEQYRKVLRQVHGTLPLRTPRPGEFLLQIVPSSSPSKHYLVHAVDILKMVADDIAVLGLTRYDRSR
jgi:hypothetical protein